MRFKRISTDTVRCIVTQDELKENGLEMDDFLSNNGRTEEFLRKMITLAEQEVGFKVQGGPLTIQVAVLPENKLALTFSEKQAGNLMEILEGLRSAMSNLSNAVNEKTKEKAAKAPVPSTKKDLYLLEFTDLKSLQAFCAGLADDIEEQLQMNSELYLLEDENVYCLILRRGEMDEKQICRIMSASIEFLDAVSAHEGQVAYIREHGKSVLTDHAISQMQRLVRH
ncbi:MAG: adaptor protein MecA [Lachnospiraceae bacterium]